MKYKYEIPNNCSTNTIIRSMLNSDEERDLYAVTKSSIGSDNLREHRLRDISYFAGK